MNTPTNSGTMTNSENIQLAADHKRSDAKRKLSQMFQIPDEHPSGTVEQIVDDIIAAAILEITAIQAKASESNEKLRDQISANQ